MRWSELGINTQREPAHSLLTRAGYVELDGRTFTPLGERLLATLFPGCVETRTAPLGTRARQKLLVAQEYLVAPGGSVPALFTTVPDGDRLLAESAHGDERIGVCTACGHRTAVAGQPPAQAATDEPLVEHHTPDCPGIEAVVAHFPGLTADRMLKCFAAGDTIVLVPGDRQVRNAPAGDVRADLPVGYIGPMGLQERGIRVLADYAVRARPGPWCTGANKPDHHVTGATLGRDFHVDEWGSFASLTSGDPCPQCGGALNVVPAFEVRSAAGTVGASRLVGLLAEQYSDDAGLVLPAAASPFDVHVVSLRGDDAADAAAALDGPNVLWDDRDASPGVKFADADLIGIPTQLVVGAKSLARGMVERKDRATGTRTEIPLADLTEL